MKKVHIVKIGGNVLDDPETLGRFLDDFVQIEGPTLLVHGGGKAASRFSERLGIAPKMVDGRRITDGEALEVVTMVYGGLINKNLVAQLQSREHTAMGLTGADGNTLPAIKREHPTIDFGFVGDIEEDKVDTKVLIPLLKAGITPIFCALTHDGQGQLLNTNADTIAAALAKALSHDHEVQLTYCFEKKGVLMNAEDDNSLIPSIDAELYEQLKKDKVIHAGMIPKLHNAFEALHHGVSAVHIKHAAHLLEDIGTQLIRK